MMFMYSRWLAPTLKFEKPYVRILFGARQTGKSTLLRNLLNAPDVDIDLAEPGQRSRYLARPELLTQECLALPTRREPYIVFIDEAQNVPALFDAVQHLYDRHKQKFRFILSGSSARKLRLLGSNLLPGRALVSHLHPLMLLEQGQGFSESMILPIDGEISVPNFPKRDLVDHLAFGDLPGIVLADEQDRAELLRSYAYVYLEEELRREALIKDWATFSRFLRLAASEAGNIINYAHVANEAGISAPTVKSHYQLLEDIFIGIAVQGFSGSKRKQLLSAPRFLFFDMGVRNAAAELPIDKKTVAANPGPIFEQWVGLELYRRLRYQGRGTLLHYRTKGGAEIDYIVDTGDELIPVEVKWTENPSATDARHVRSFLDDHSRKAKKGFIVCRCPKPLQIDDAITAIPWERI
jgi:uncharacterized protein